MSTSKFVKNQLVLDTWTDALTPDDVDKLLRRTYQSTSFYKFYCILTSIEKNPALSNIRLYLEREFDVAHATYDLFDLLENEFFIFSLLLKITAIQPTHLVFPITINHKTNLIPSVSYPQQPPINFTNLSLTQGLPIIESQDKINIGSIFNLKTIDVWYPSGSFATLRSVLSILFKHCQLTQGQLILAETILDNLNFTVENPTISPLVESFLSTFTCSDDNYTRLLKTLLNSLHLDPSNKNLTSITSTLLSSIATSFKVPLSTPPVLNLQLARKCTLFNYTTILPILEQYPNFEPNYIITGDVCLAQIQTILSIFPYYNYKKWILNPTIENGKIKVMIADQHKPTKHNHSCIAQYTKNMNFSYNFARDYAYIESLSISNLHVEKLLHHYYSMTNLKYACVGALIYQSRFGLDLGGREMYNIISSIPHHKLSELDSILNPNNEIIPETHQTNIGWQLLNTFLIKQSKEKELDLQPVNTSTVDQLINSKEIINCINKTITEYEVLYYYLISKESLSPNKYAQLLFLLTQTNTSSACKKLFNIKSFSKRDIFDKFDKDQQLVIIPRSIKLNKSIISNQISTLLSSGRDLCSNRKAINDFCIKTSNKDLLHKLGQYKCPHYET